MGIIGAPRPRLEDKREAKEKISWQFAFVRQDGNDNRVNDNDDNANAGHCHTQQLNR